MSSVTIKKNVKLDFCTVYVLRLKLVSIFSSYYVYFQDDLVEQILLNIYLYFVSSWAFQIAMLFIYKKITIILSNEISIAMVDEHT